MVAISMWGLFKGTNVQRVDDREKAMWIEVVHETNMDNDVKMTFDTCLITNKNKLIQEYGVPVILSEHSRVVYFTRFLAVSTQKKAQ